MKPATAFRALPNANGFLRGFRESRSRALTIVDKTNADSLDRQIKIVRIGITNVALLLNDEEK